MADIKRTDLTKLKKQMNSLVNEPGGKERLFDVIYRLIANDQQPAAIEYDADGSIISEETRTIANARYDVLLSESMSVKSLWFRINYELADIILNKEKLINNTTGDELRLIKAYANTLTDPDKTDLLNIITKVEPTDEANRFNLPEINEG